MCVYGDCCMRMADIRKTAIDVFRKYCPKWSILRNSLNNIKLSSIRRKEITVEDIKNGEKHPENRKDIVNKYIRSRRKELLHIWDVYNAYVKKYTISCCERNNDELKYNILFYYLAYGFMPDEYFLFNLTRKTVEDAKSYLSDRDKELIAFSLNDIIDIGVFNDKFETYKVFWKYYKREAICLTRKKDLESYLSFVNRHPVFVCKQTRLSKGNSVELVNIENTVDAYAVFEEKIRTGQYIVEEVIQQSEKMKIMSLKSVNTVRIMTFNVGGNIKIGPCFFKAGRGTSFVDNGGAGGILVGINNQSGILETNGFDEGMRTYETHPDTGVTFRGFMLPEWKDVINLARKLSALVPSIKYIGWDFAHTDQGWIVVEGNGSGQFIVPQIVWQRGFREDIERLVQA